MGFLLNPNLPQNKVSLVLVNGKEKEVINALKSLNIAVLDVPECSYIEKGISSHPDMNILYLGSGKYIGYENILSDDFKFIPETIPTEPNYKKSTKLNCALTNEFLIFNPKTASDKIPLENRVIIETNQGYSKCSTLIIDKESIITADDNIELAALKKRLNVLKVSQSEILLEGYSNGFIGGIGGKLDKSILGICGELKYLKDKNKILDFCRNVGVYIESITKGKIKDIGGVIPLKETD